MGEPSLGTPVAEQPLEDRLDSWKEIASYLKRDVWTVGWAAGSFKWGGRMETMA
jgi:hypothetical protein